MQRGAVEDSAKYLQHCLGFCEVHLCGKTERIVAFTLFDNSVTKRR